MVHVEESLQLPRGFEGIIELIPQTRPLAHSTRRVRRKWA